MFADSRRLNFILFIVYKFLLDVTYVTIQSEVFAYSGYDRVISADRYFIGWAVFLVTTYFVCKWHNNLYSLFMYIIHLMTMVPFIVFYQFFPECELWMVLVQCFGLLFMMVIFCVRREGIFSIGSLDFVSFNNNTRKFNFNDTKFQIILIVGLVAFFAISFVEYGVPTLESMLFANVYETRAEAESTSLILVLFQNLFCKILLPFCIMWYAKNKQWLLMGVCLSVQIYTYAVTGLKTYLFIPIVLMAIYFVKNLNIERIALCGIIAVTILVDVLYYSGQDIIWYALVGNRLFFLPARIKFSYFDYFSHHDFANFSQSSFAHVFGVTSNYFDNIPNMIGDLYFNKPQMWTNTGFIADAYSNLGVIGIILMSIVLAIALRYSNKIVSDIPSPYNNMVKAIFLIFFIALNDGAVISVLFSGGMIAAIIIFNYLSFDNNQEGDEYDYDEDFDEDNIELKIKYNEGN